MRARICEAGVFLLFVSLAPCKAQKQDAPSGTASTKTDSTGTATTQKSTGDGKKPKKVWTNDELGSVKGAVSVVGDGNATGGEAGAKKSSDSVDGPVPQENKDARQKQVEAYREQIRQLQAQIDAADKRIAQLRNFKGENTSPAGGINPNQGYNMVPIEDQVRQLEDKKKQVQAKIDDVESGARKNGIEPGELR
jgi:TolA-binding protein